VPTGQLGASWLAVRAAPSLCRPPVEQSGQCVYSMPQALRQAAASQLRWFCGGGSCVKVLIANVGRLAARLFKLSTDTSLRATIPLKAMLATTPKLSPSIALTLLTAAAVVPPSLSFPAPRITFDRRVALVKRAAAADVGCAEPCVGLTLASVCQMQGLCSCSSVCCFR